MTLLGFLGEKYHKSISEVSFFYNFQCFLAICSVSFDIFCVLFAIIKRKARCVKGIAQNQEQDLGTQCPRIVHSVPTACSLSAHGLFTQCPRLVHPVPTAWSFSAHGLVTQCPRLVHPVPTACSSSAHLMVTGETSVWAAFSA